MRQTNSNFLTVMNNTVLRFVCMNLYGSGFSGPKGEITGDMIKS